MSSGDLDFTSATVCNVTVPGCGRSYAFRVFAVDTNGGVSPYSEPTDFVQTENDPPTIDGISTGSSYSTGTGDVTGTSTPLSAAVTYDGDTNDLTYLWSVAPPSGGDAWFDDDTAASPTLYFTEAGSYDVTLEVDDGYPVTGVQSLANPDLIVVVDHTLTSIDLSPDAAVVPYGLTRQFTATGIDQFGDTMALTSPSWTIDNSGPGQVSAGLYAVPASGSGGSATIRVAANGISATADVSLVERNYTTIDFEDLSNGTAVTTQYYASDGVTFSCDSGCVNHAASGQWAASGMYLRTDPAVNGDTWSHPLTVTFAQPVNGLSFLEMFENTSGHIFDVDVYEDFSATATATEHHYGHASSNLTTWGSQTIDLSAYHDVTEIHLYNIDDPWGLWWDNFRFVLPPPQLLDLTATDAADATNHTTATDAALYDLYVRGDDDGTGHVNFDVEFDPMTTGSSGTGQYVHLLVVPNDPETGDPIFGSQTAVENTDLTNTHTFQNIALPTSGGYCSYTAFAFVAPPGQYTEPPTGAPVRKDKIDVINAGIRSDNNGDGVVNATDDALNAVQPNALNLEGDGPRTEVDLSVGVPGGNGRRLEGRRPKCLGRGVLDGCHRRGGVDPQRQRQRDRHCPQRRVHPHHLGFRRIGHDAFRHGELRPGGAAGDAKIQLQVKNQAGQIVTQISIGVNKPVEVLYAVDGTNDTAADNDNVRRFWHRYQGNDTTNIDKHYYPGPQQLNGSDSPQIVTNVENNIGTDYSTALQRHRKLVIDLLGFSRGAVIVGDGRYATGYGGSDYDGL